MYVDMFQFHLAVHCSLAAVPTEILRVWRASGALSEEIWMAGSPEEAAKLGRAAQRQQPELVRSDWLQKQV